MNFLIPSWYADNRRWMMAAGRDGLADAAGDASHQGRADDTIGQIRALCDAGRECVLVVPFYSPGLRRFLHSQGIWPASVWSVFDRLQGITVQELGLLSWRDADWPDSMKWVETPDGVEGILGGKKAAAVVSGAEGELYQVDTFDQDGKEQVRSQIYDDRGFLSSVLTVQKGVLQSQEFLDEDGRLQFTMYGKGRVEFSPRAHFASRKKVYEDADDLIAEVLQDYFARADFESADTDYSGSGDRSAGTGGRNTVLIAADDAYDSVILRTLHGPRVWLSFQGARFDLSKKEQLKRELRKADGAVADTEETAAVLKDAASLHLEVSTGTILPVVAQTERPDSQPDQSWLQTEQAEGDTGLLTDSAGKEAGASGDRVKKDGGTLTDHTGQNSRSVVEAVRSSDGRGDVEWSPAGSGRSGQEQVIYYVRWEDAAEDLHSFDSKTGRRQLHLVKEEKASAPETVLRIWDSAPVCRDYSQERPGTQEPPQSREPSQSQGHPREPQLPLLSPGETFHVRLFAVCSEGTYLRIRSSFYNKAGEPVGEQETKGTEGIVTCPPGMHRYRISLIREGGGAVLFHHIELQKTQKTGAEDRKAADGSFALCVLLPDCSGHMYRMPDTGRLTISDNICLAPSEAVMPAPFRSVQWLNRPELLQYKEKYFIACTPEAADAAALLELEGYGTAVILSEPKELYGMSMP